MSSLKCCCRNAARDNDLRTRLLIEAAKAGAAAVDPEVVPGFDRCRSLRPGRRPPRVGAHLGRVGVRGQPGRPAASELLDAGPASAVVAPAEHALDADALEPEGVVYGRRRSAAHLGPLHRTGRGGRPEPGQGRRIHAPPSCSRVRPPGPCGRDITENEVCGPSPGDGEARTADRTQPPAVAPAQREPPPATIIEVTGDVCRHDLVMGTCSICKFDDRPAVHITAGGRHFHARPDCPALLDGQRAVDARGGTTEPIETVPRGSSRLEGRDRCLRCAPN